MLAQAVLHPLRKRQAADSVRNSSFYGAMRFMPAGQRAAMYEIYHFCRAVDDIADDGQGSAHDRIAVLHQWRNHIGLLYAGHTPTALQGLAEAISAFDLRREDFLAVIDGMEMDVRGFMQAPDEATLTRYCDRVACAVGRLSVRIFGMPEQDGLGLAYHLGMALQLINILRDIDDDGGMGRLYLPRELLHDAGIEGRTPEEVLAHPAAADVCLRLLARASAHFYKADGIMEQYQPELVRTPRIMSEAYQAVHSALLNRGFAYPRRKIKTSKAGIGLMLVKSMLS